MKAALLHAYGAPLQISEVPDPGTPGPDEVLIRVRASSLNPIDSKIRQGGQRGVLRYRLPWITGLDVSGELLAVGTQVQGFAVGDAVYASTSPLRPGCFAEQVLVPARDIARIPPGLSHTEAATIPLVGLTVWQSFMPHLAQQGPGQRVFIHAGAGGVGTFAIQLARHLGAEVATTCSPGSAQLVSALGARTVIDYRRQRFEDVLSGQDLVLDALGGEARDRSFRVLRRGGRLASLVSGLPGNTARYGPSLGVLATALSLVRFRLQGLRHGIQTAVVIRRADGAQLAQITDLIAQGAIRPVVDRVYPLAEIAQAQAYLEEGHARGKVAITID